MTESEVKGEALALLGEALWERGYHFVTPTPATHARVVARRARAESLRDVFGWSLPFERSILPRPVALRAEEAGVLEEVDGGLRATVRFSSLRRHLFVHSAYPTDAPDAVFFGPDTYRFASFVERHLPPCRRLVDVGCGSGAGGLVAAQRAGSIVLADINAKALGLAKVNARLVGVKADVRQSDVLESVDGAFDAVIANPPYLIDGAKRAYRHGDGAHGEGLSLRIVRDALRRLSPGGTLLLYTGAAVVDGVDRFRVGAEVLCAERGVSFDYEELDPDVFGEELDHDAYRDVERIAAVGLRVRIP